MRFKSLICFILVALSVYALGMSQRVWANKVCGGKKGVLRTSNSTSHRQSWEEKVQFSSEFSRSEINQVLEVVRKLDAQIGDLSRPPLKFELLHSRDYLRSKYVPGPRKTMGMEIGDEHFEIALGINPKALKASQTIIAHEIGHAVFDSSYIMVVGSRSGSVQELERFFRKKIEDLENEPQVKVLFEEWQSLSFVKEKVDRFNELSHKLNQLFFPLKEGLDTVKKTRWSLIPHNEIFADLFAVTFAGRLDAMAEALGLPNSAPYSLTNLNTVEIDPLMLEYRKENPNAPRPRDFSQDIDFTGWRPDQDIYDHTVLDPVRSHIGKKYLSNVNFVGEIPGLLWAIINSSKRQLQLRLYRGEDPQEKLENAGSFNRKYRDLLDQEQEKRKLDP